MDLFKQVWALALPAFAATLVHAAVVIPPICPGLISGETYFPLQVASVVDHEISQPGRRLYRLGAGTSGIALKSVRGKTFKVVKAYYDIQVTPTDYDRSTSRDTDLLVLNELAKLECVEAAGFIVAGGIKSQLTLINTPRTGSANVQAIEFSEGIIGRTVLSLVSDTTLSTELRRYLNYQYGLRMKRLSKCLIAHRGGVPAKSMTQFYKNLGVPVFQLPFIVMQIELRPSPYSYTSTQVLIKSDGIIVDPVTLEFHLVDPA